MGQYDKASRRSGVALTGHGRTSAEEVPRLLALSHDEDALTRRLAVKNLCPCHVRSNVALCGTAHSNSQQIPTPESVAMSHTPSLMGLRANVGRRSSRRWTSCGTTPTGACDEWPIE